MTFDCFGVKNFMQRYILSSFVAVITFALGAASIIPFWFFQSLPVRKTIKFVTVQNILPIVEVSNTESITEIKEEQEHGVYGYFFIAGKVSREFSDISEILIDQQGWETADDSDMCYGLLRLKKDKLPDYYLHKPIVNGNKISFRTKAVRGVSYEFKGILKKNFDELPYETIVMRGTLKKMKAGKTIAESKVGFNWYLGC